MNVKEHNYRNYKTNEIENQENYVLRLFSLLTLGCAFTYEGEQPSNQVSLEEIRAYAETVRDEMTAFVSEIIR